MSKICVNIALRVINYKIIYALIVVNIQTLIVLNVTKIIYVKNAQTIIFCLIRIAKKIAYKLKIV